MTRKSNPAQTPEYFVTENGKIKDPCLISNQLNNFFVNVGQDISKSHFLNFQIRTVYFFNPQHACYFISQNKIKKNKIN